MGEVLDGLRGQLRRLGGERRNRLMVALFAGATLLSTATYAHRTLRELPVAILDADGTSLSRMLSTWIDATPELAAVATPPASLDEAQRALVRGDLAAVVVLPGGLATDVKRGRQAEVLVVVDMSNVLVGKTALRSVQRVLATAGAGVQRAVLAKLGTPWDRALPRAMPITVVESLSENPGSSFAVYMAPPLAFFFLHVLTLFLAGSVPGIGRPGPDWRQVTGAMAAILAVAFLLGMSLFELLLPALGVPPASSTPLLATTLLLFLAVDLLLASALAAASGGALVGFQVTVLLGMLSLMISGLTWPWEAIPAPLRALASVIPYTPFGRILRLALHEPATWGTLLRPVGWLAAQGGAFAALITGATVVARLRAPARAATETGGVA